MDQTRACRHRYIIEDPARLGCLAAAAALLYLPELPFGVTLFVMAVTQLAPIMMAARAMEQGWSRRYGAKLQPTVYTSNLSMDFTVLSACTVVGALLLVRHFNGAEVVRPLGILAVAICFLPDIRVCRFLLAGDPREASKQLRDGAFFRDPVMIAVIVATGVILALDRASLTFVLISLTMLQFNGLLVLVDKYLPEIEARAHAGWKAFLLEREGRRLWLVFAPLMLIPARLFLGDRAAGWGASLIGAIILAPDLCRLSCAAARGVSNLFRVTPQHATYIVLPK